MRDQAAARILFAPRQLPPLRPDAAHDPGYPAWARRREEERLASPPVGGPAAPPVTVVLAIVDPVDPRLVERSLSSLARQTCDTWRLSVAFADGPDPLVAEAVARSGVAGARTEVPAGTPAAAALGAALAVAAPVDAGAGVLVLWPGDELAPDALDLLGRRLAGSGAPLVYGDSDLLDADGRRHGPVLVGEWSPDLCLSAPYLGRALLVRHDALVAAGGFVPVAGGSAEHDLMLRLTDSATAVPHVPEVLYHRHAPVGSPPWPDAPGAAAVVAALERRGDPATVEAGPVPGTFGVARTVAPGHRASIVVPFRDGAPLLRVCVDTVTGTAAASGVALQLVLVDNGSTDPETLSLVERFEGRDDVVVRRDGRAFNWAALNNAAAADATGDVLVFLNNDIECRRAGWLEALVTQALRAEVGAVGARLLYPDGRLQHAGVVVGMGGAAGHVLAGLDPGEPGYAALAVLTRDVSAVTGACLATRREVFERLGGFDESLGLDLNDVDYCLRAARDGLRVVYEPRAELVHHESPSRGTSGSIDDIERFIERWEALITAGDLHLNANLTRVDSSCALRGTDEMAWWREWRSSLRRS